MEQLFLQICAVFCNLGFSCTFSFNELITSTQKKSFDAISYIRYSFGSDMYTALDDKILFTFQKNDIILNVYIVVWYRNNKKIISLYFENHSIEEACDISSVTLSHKRHGWLYFRHLTYCIVPILISDDNRFPNLPPIGTDLERRPDGMRHGEDFYVAFPVYINKIPEVIHSMMLDVGRKLGLPFFMGNRVNFLKLVEGVDTNTDFTEIMRYILNPLIIKEVCSYII